MTERTSDLDALQRWQEEQFFWLHRHPELALHEYETTARIKALLRGMPGVELLDLGLETGALAEIAGPAGGEAVLLRADIDALPITEESDLPYVSEHVGRMHACGHDFHTAALLGAARLLSQERETLPGRVYLLFQPAEEDERGGARVVETGLFERSPISLIYALHTRPNVPVGTIQISEGAFSASVDHFSYTITGRGCHASAPHNGLDPITAAGRLLTALQEIVSRRISPMEPAVISVTSIHAGTTWNVIPDTAKLEGTVRTFSGSVRAAICEHMEHLAAGLRLEGYRAELHVDFGCPATDNDAEAVGLIRRVALRQGWRVERQTPGMGGEDFSCLQEKAPGALFHIGTGPSAPAHNAAFRADPAALSGGAALLAGVARESLAALAAKHKAKE